MQSATPLPRPALPRAFLRAPIAHRALHDITAGRPENSRAAVEAAVAAGYGIEVDLQLSADGRAMVFHDYSLGRLTPGTGPLRAQNAAALAAVPLLHGNEGIPDFTEILRLVAGRVPLLVEIKDQDGAMGPAIGALEAAAAEALRGYEGPVSVMSFNPHTVAEMARLCPDLPRGLVTSSYAAEDWGPLPAAVRDRLRDIPDYEASGAAFLSHQWNDLDRPRVAELVAAGAELLCWTIRSPEAERIARLRASNITFEGYAAAIPVA